MVDARDRKFAEEVEKTSAWDGTYGTRNAGRQGGLGALLGGSDTTDARAVARRERQKHLELASTWRRQIHDKTRRAEEDTYGEWWTDDASRPETASSSQIGGFGWDDERRCNRSKNNNREVRWVLGGLASLYLAGFDAHSDRRLSCPTDFQLAEEWAAQIQRKSESREQERQRDREYKDTFADQMSRRNGAGARHRARRGSSLADPDGIGLSVDDQIAVLTRMLKNSK